MDRRLIQKKCYAKINLYLKVLGKRADGFHQLETILQTIDLYDDLVWDLSEEAWRFFVLNGPDFGKSNLVIRAANLYAEHTGIKLQGRMQLTKRIPIGGGLGGGSSNAAATLSILNDKYRLLSAGQLASLAAELGSDVPFFLEGGCQWGSGRGEILRPFHWKGVERSGFLLIPDFQMATPAVFAALRAPDYVPASSDCKERELPHLGENDLFAAACRVNPKIETIASQLSSELDGGTFFMSGSGSTLVYLTAQAGSALLVEDLANRYGVQMIPFQFV